MRIATISVLILLACACRKTEAPDTSRDEYGCLYPGRYLSQEVPGPDPEELRDYESCNLHARFHQGCLSHGGTDLGGVCRRVRDDHAAYTAPTEYTRSFGFTDAWWIDCKPHAKPYAEPGDDPQCLEVEPGDDPSGLAWACITPPPEWCPPNP